MGLLLFLVLYCVLQSGVLDDVADTAKRCMIRLLIRWMK